MNRRGLPALAILGIALICQVCAAQEITVAAAADLQSAMQDVAARFERETGKKVKVIFGSS
jgi:molybdate transport system substrate-binding protein